MMHKLHIALKQKLDEAQAIINEMMSEEPKKMGKEEYLNKSEDERAMHDKKMLEEEPKEDEENK